MMQWRLLFLSGLLVLTIGGCRKYEITVVQQRVDSNYLASTHVDTPDPRQACPPCGQMVTFGWRLPRCIVAQHPCLIVHLLFWDYTEKILTFPIDRPRGYVTYELLNEEFNKRRGILTYKAEIITEEGEVYREWKHQLWVNLINIDEEPPIETPLETNESSAPEN